MSKFWQIVRKAAKWTGIVLLSLVLYVGSAGPVTWLYVHYRIPTVLEPVVSAAYSPLVKLEKVIYWRLEEPLNGMESRHKLLKPYFRWWLDLRLSPHRTAGRT